jgi:outer membrane protein, heavy metal efflux system
MLHWTVSDGTFRAGRATTLLAGTLVLAALASPEARGQETTPAPLTLDEAERRALQMSPALQAAEARVRLEEGRRRQATLYPNPDLALDALRFTDGSGPKETTLALRQPIPYHGKRALARQEADALIEAARHDRERVRLDLLLEVREVFYRIHFTGEILKVEEEDLQATTSLRKAVEARVSAGDAPALESLKATVEVSRAENDRGRVRGELAALIASFNLLLGMPAEAPTTVTAPELDLEPGADLPVLRERAIGNQPAIQAREETARAAGFAAERARLERRPDLAVGPTFGRDERTYYVGLGVSLKLPAWNRNQGNIAAADAGRDEAVAEAGAARLDVSRTLAEAYGRYHSAHAQQLLYEQGLLDEATHLLESARKSYEGGESGILEFLDARRTALAVREGYYLASLDAAMAGLQLRRAMGEGAEGVK